MTTKRATQVALKKRRFLKSAILFAFVMLFLYGFSTQRGETSSETVASPTTATLATKKAPGSGGPGKFAINTNDPTCAWRANSEAPWIVINSGVGVGSGPAHFTVLANNRSARTGRISINGIAGPVSIEQAPSGPAFATVSGQVLTPSPASRPQCCSIDRRPSRGQEDKS